MKNYSQFHDGWFDGFWIQGPSVHVHLRTSRKEPFTLICTGVFALSADGFREGNIIFEALIRDPSGVTVEHLRKLRDFVQSSLGQNQAQKMLEEVRKRQLLLFELNPSYGAGCLILAEAYDLLPTTEWERCYCSARQ